ncbi:GNAT family N-acetyltransferase [Chitinophaga sp. Cy-1792]|uniref:GNAT family N-acetyltransferase n=1 Tax=Chitinophaga sp. Cy-1792 TaxID=2608339 RepID=UPI00142057BF|nr:GNAT family N-acetyltransferase [Chitinophaga sp. Cy-1792]NIG54137.1 GNAT family N-acetyltransferase [Chitinophaga sp. Cy-1792]
MQNVDPHIAATWLKGWCLAKGARPPVKIKDGYRVDLGWADQHSRYLFPRITPALHELAAAIHKPFVHLKVCDAPEKVTAALPGEWRILSLGYMMELHGQMASAKFHLPEGFVIEKLSSATVPAIRILTLEGEEAASGRVAIIDNFAVYDSIAVSPAYRRKGLGSILMHYLQHMANDNNTDYGLLVATDDGKALYETLGWKLISLYTTAHIPFQG